MKRAIFYRADGNYDVDEASEVSGLACFDPSLAIQSQIDEADINSIVKRFGLTGELPLNKRVPLPEGMFVESLDYRECLDTVKAAEASFMSLPAAIRTSFENDAEQFVLFAEDSKNLDKLREWGLAPPAPVTPPEAAVPA
ncbi:MAG: internal scaffolding protein [Arizlama microvirus]|nr:MAG: internal scaffolding protein [Arizlama microvirus]